MKKNVDIDLFAHIRAPLRLRSGAGGVALLLRQADIGENRYRCDLWLLGREGLRPLTRSGDVSSFWWDENTGALLLIRQDQRQGEECALLRLAPPWDGPPREWMRLPREPEELLVLPGGELLYTAARDTRPGGGAPPGCSGAEREACEVLEELPFWAEGEGFTSGRRRGLWLWREGAALPLTDEDLDVEMLRLSPTGEAAFFVGSRRDAADEADNGLFRLDISRGTVTEIGYAPPYSHHNYTVLDDAHLLVFGTDRAAYGLNQNGGFSLLPLTGEGPRALCANGAYNGGDAVLSDVKTSEGAVWCAGPGGVYWTATLDAATHLMRIDAGDGEIEQLTTQPGAVTEFALWEGRVILAALRGQAGPELYELLPGGEERCLTEFNTALAQEWRLAASRPLQARSRAGDTLQGWVMRPAGLRAGERAPAVLMIHGGPKMAYGDILFHEMQFLAARGFGVVWCNPTGSDGKGDAFADIRGRYGRVDCDDVMRFLDRALAAEDWIDPERLGVTGGSYGGFLAGWLISHTDCFRAAVSERGISHWGTMARLSDIGRLFVSDQIGVDVLADTAEMWDVSPLKYAGNISTPTLFIHGEADYRCPVDQSMQLYAALRQRGVPARLCLFGGEGHELSRSGKPAARLRRLREIGDWFARYL